MLNSFGGSPEIDLVVRAIDETQSGFNGVSTGLGLIAAGAAAVVAAVTAVSAAVVQVTKVTLAWGQSLSDTKLKLGDTTAQAAGLQLAADAVGVSIDQVTTTIMRLEKGLQTANGQEGASAKILDDLKIKYKDANGQMMDSTTLLQSVADWFASATDATARNNMELTIFGRSGADIDRMLMNLSGGGMQSYMDQAKKMGLVMTDDQLNKIVAVNEQMNILKDAFKGAEVELGGPFIQVLQNLVTWFGNMLAAEMPAIQQFGQFLGMMTGSKPGMPSMPLTSGTPASGTPGGITLAPWATTADIAYAMAHPEKYYIPGTPGTSTGIPGDTNAGGYGIGTGRDKTPPPLVLTPFEKAIQSFVTGIQTNWPPFEKGIADFIAGVAPLITILNQLVPHVGTTPPKTGTYPWGGTYSMDNNVFGAPNLKTGISNLGGNINYTDGNLSPSSRAFLLYAL